MCDADGMEGLTWAEVKKCEDDFADTAAAHNYSLPSQADFESADLNGDGVLRFEEWEKWVIQKCKLISPTFKTSM